MKTLTLIQRMILATLIVTGLASTQALAVKVADITRMSGQRTSSLTGLGLVYGLKGTGDGGSFQPAIRPLASMLEHFNDQATVEELSKVKNVALVALIATVPANGVMEGDRIDVTVMSIGSASSLAGGRLFVTPMTGPVPGAGILALADGAIVLEDANAPLVGRIKAGCTMETTLMAEQITDGRFTLVLDDPSASWTNASTIAKIINDAESTTGEIIALALDPKNVVVTIPPSERQRPDSFISRVQRLPVPMLPNAAKVLINERTGTMIITGDVEISPVVISHKGLTISTIQPSPTPSARTPVVTNHDMIALDPGSQGGAKLQDLVAALDQLKVPAEDRIIIVKQLYESGKLHAQLITE